MGRKLKRVMAALLRACGIFSILQTLCHVKVVRLHRKGRSERHLIEAESREDCRMLLEDLSAYTGLSDEELRARLLRSPATHYKSEFQWHSPGNERELTWFYRCSYGYLFANAIHPPWDRLDRLELGIGRVLDYGGGAGIDTISLARRGFQVDYFDISIIQSDFVRFRAQRRGLDSIRIILPFANGRFDPVNAVQDTYAAIVARDVFEHIPDYHILLAHLIEHVQPGGLIMEDCAFKKDDSGIAMHMKASVPLEEAMAGMEQTEPGIWKKL